MSGVESLARVLVARMLDPAESFTDVDGEMSLRIFSGKRLAERILADPDPLLEALAEAGVLREEWSPRIVGRHDQTIVPAQRCYVTEWKPAEER